MDGDVMKPSTPPPADPRPTAHGFGQLKNHGFIPAHGFGNARICAVKGCGKTLENHRVVAQ